ncbi:MAG: hypothetical protein DDT37_01816 [Firmicutes bacterium]|nr:hypothetical protein [candidate division NPL-UPA2 bacterium]
MFETLSNDDISSALDELIACLGVKEEMPFHDLLALLRKKDTEGCVREIATRLGLPIRISLSYVPKDFRPGSADGFRTSALARTDWTGHGIEGITAQVAIPQNLPMFGTSGLQGYPIRVRVSENCLEHPQTFVAVMAHEVSHVLLASLYHSKKDSELHADLVPVILGFRGVVRQGRALVQSSTNGNVTTTQTTTYGYLTDSQFDFSCNHVSAIVERYQRNKGRLLELIGQLHHKLHTATRHLTTFRDYLAYLDTHAAGKMRQADARRVVQCHACDYTRDWEIGITKALTSVDNAERFLRPLNHYTTSAVERIQDHGRSLELATGTLDSVIEGIGGDLRTLGRYISLLYRLRNRLYRRWLRAEVDK